MSSADELKRCIELLKKVAEDRTVLSPLTTEERRELMIAAGRVSRPERDETRKLSRRLRVMRKDERKAGDRAIRAGTQIRVARRESVYVPPMLAAPETGKAEEGPELSEARYCYICKGEFRRLHFFYDALCPSCAEFNYAKRFQKVSLAGRYAVITGARLKIGYQASLMMLRAGATVVATTRFPHDATRRYAAEKDFSEWQERLLVDGLDLRHSPSVELFCHFLDRTLPQLDILVNNAAQTVRRPAAFYRHLLEREALPHGDLAPEERKLLRSHEELKGVLGGASATAGGQVDATGLAVWHRGGPGVGLRESAMLSQMKYAYEDAELGLDVFPTGKTDADEQQVDLRTMNSWRMTLGDVPTAEMLMLQLINAVAPFILCSKLKPMMLRRPLPGRHIVNVSAMEGIFSRHTKTDKHPHTNMAKAALNMLTVTSAPDYAKDGIFMNAVDTGWVTDEDPAHLSTRKQEEHDFQPPLDIVDGAARVCDPFFSGLASGDHAWGKFFKDYKPASW